MTGSQGAAVEAGRAAAALNILYTGFHREDVKVLSLCTCISINQTEALEDWAGLSDQQTPALNDMHPKKEGRLSPGSWQRLLTDQ